jgi:GT2 family glycosyltransferase
VKDKTVLVSVVLVCHNDGKWLSRCLESLRRQTVIDQVEVIVADNASADGSDQLARDLLADWPNTNARFLSTGGDLGYGVACNRAAQVALGQFLYLLNPDTWLEPNCIEELYHAAERNHATVAGATVLNYEEDTVQGKGSSGFDFCGNSMDVDEKHQSAFLLTAAGFFFIRREAFLRIGAMDQEFFLYGEEMDLSWRVWISGGTIVPAPAARIHHRGAVNVDPSATARAAQNRTSVQKRFLSNRNRLLFIAKDCQHILLAMLLPCLAIVLLEGAAAWLMTRSWSLAKSTTFDAVASAWGLRGHIRAERRRVAAFRRHGDWWMLRFFRFGFGRWAEIAKILEGGFPKFR